MDVARDFYEKARDHLGYRLPPPAATTTAPCWSFIDGLVGRVRVGTWLLLLLRCRDIFDVADYSVAQALERIPALTRFFCESPEEAHRCDLLSLSLSQPTPSSRSVLLRLTNQLCDDDHRGQLGARACHDRLSTYYITLSMQMCRSLGAINSFTYLQCLLTSTWYSAVDGQEFEALGQHPYYSGLESAPARPHVHHHRHHTTMNVRRPRAGSPQYLAEKFHLPFVAQKKLMVCFHCVGVLMKSIYQYRYRTPPDMHHQPPPATTQATPFAPPSPPIAHAVRCACRARCIPDRYQFDPSDHRLLHALEEEQEQEQEEEASWPACASRESSSRSSTNPLAIHNLLTADQEPREDHSDFDESEDKEADRARPVRAAALGRLQSPRNLLRMPSYPFASAVLQSAADLEVLLPVLDNASAALGELLQQGFASANLHALGIFHFESLRAGTMPRTPTSVRCEHFAHGP
jgi:hypothetical protein